MGNRFGTVTQWIPGAVSATFRKTGLTVDEILALCQECHLSAIEWSENAHVMPNDPEGARLLGEKTRSAGLRIAAYGSYYRLGMQADVFRASLVSAKALGAPIIRVWAGTTGSQETPEDTRDSWTREARTIAQIAAQEKIRVAFEWHKGTLTDTNQSAARLMREADHENLYCLWQPTVALSPRERAEGIEQMARYLTNFHVYSWPDGTRGPLNAAEWQYYFEKAHGLSGEHFALLEFVRDDSIDQFRSDARTLLSLVTEGEENG